jgi:hypothetical protein
LLLNWEILVKGELELIKIDGAFLDLFQQNHCSLLDKDMIISFGSDDTNSEVEMGLCQPWCLEVAMASAWLL